MHPFSLFGFDGSFWIIEPDPILFTCLGSLFSIFFLRYGMSVLKTEQDKDERSLISNIFESAGESLYTLIQDTVAQVDQRLFSFIGSIFTLLAFCNCLVLLPFCEEPTKNINVAFAFGIIAFFMIHFLSFCYTGISYWEHWFVTPLSLKRDLFITKNYEIFSFFEYCIRCILNIIIACTLFPFECLTRFSLLISLSFRLFGNIFGGAMVASLVDEFLESTLLYKVIGLCTGIPFLVMGFFGLFEGIIQAFVFAIVSLNNIGILSGEALTKERKKD